MLTWVLYPSEDRLAKLTKRQRIHIRSYFQTGFVLLAALAIIVGTVLLIARAVRGGSERRAEALSETYVQEAEAMPSEPSAIPASTPEPTPVPTPEPPDVDVNSWELRLVRIDNQLPNDFVPELMEIEDGQYFDARAGMHLLKLLEDARAAGYTTFCCSGFRSYDTQYMLYWNHVEAFQAEGMTLEEAEAATRLAVNYPGASEHQLGLAADILEYQGQDMEPYIGGSGLMLWLEEHCADYGFVIRYPDGKTDITGIEYEPWHLRFVGACAWYLMENDLCLEEFLAMYQ